MGRLIRQRVDIVNHFILETKDSQGGWGILSASGVRPSYYTYQLYKMFGNELLYADSGEANVGIYAARRGDGALTLMVTNLDEAATSLPLQLDGHPGGTADIYRLDPDRVEAGTVTDPAGTIDVYSGTLLELPAYSVTLIVIP
ncbi:MAG: hypothetical protein R3C44_22255 [Chloroflexota bacterium]